MITKTSIHAVTALAALSHLPNGSYAGAGEMADKIGAPRNYLGKLLKTLANSGLVESQKGKGGGFRLARAPQDITLFDVVDLIEHLSRWNGCFLGGPRCSDKTACVIHDRWKAVRGAYLDFLKGTTIADLAHNL